MLILGYNDKKNLPDSLGSALKQTYSNYELIFIDNGSSDDSMFFLEKKYPDLRIIENKKNLGYTLAYKLALEEIFSGNFDAAVLLNSDVVVDKNWLLELVRTAFSDKEIAMAQSKILLWEDGKTAKLNSAGNKINYLGFGFCGNYKEDATKFTRDRKITYASGSSLLIKRDAYFAIGSLDAEFFTYLEDQDWGWRARLLGYEIALSAKSLVWHKYKFKNSSRNKQKYFYLERNRLYFIFKNYSFRMMTVIFPSFLFMEVGILFFSIAQGFFCDKIKSYFSFFANLPALTRDRRNIQKKRILSDRQLIEFLEPIVDFEEINSPLLRVANSAIGSYYKIVKKMV